MKKVSILLLIVIMSVSLAGCKSSNVELYNAMEKMGEVTSLESETELGFQVKAEGFEESQEEIINQMITGLNDLKVVLNQKSIANKEQTKAQAEGKMGVEFGGVSMDMEVWSDVDMDGSKMNSIIKMPAMFTSMMGPEVMNKEYIIYDIGKMMKSQDQEVNFEEMIKLQKEIQPKIVELVKDIQKNFKLAFEIIELKEEKVVNGEKVKVYELKLDDKALKELTKELVDTTLDNEGTRKFIVEYIDTVMNMQSFKLNEDLDEKEIKEEMAEVTDSLEDNMGKFKEEFNKFMEKTKDINILGEEGISIEYTVNKAGYIVETKGILDFKIDLEQIAKTMEEKPEDMKGLLSFKIDFNTKNKNINSKDIKIKLPELNKENSIDFLELMEKQMEEAQKQMEAMEAMED